jgi:hypothetical protein
MQGTMPTPMRPRPAAATLTAARLLLPSQDLLSLGYVEEDKAHGVEASKREAVEENEDANLKRRGEGVGYPDGTGTMDPNAPERGMWDALIMLFLLWYSFITPYEISFLKTEPTDFLSILNYTIDFLFLIDLFLNFKTGYFDFATGEST